MVLNRTGVVLSDSGGALEKMLPFFKAGIGGPVAGGRQYVPWVHRDDVVGATMFALDNEAERACERDRAGARDEQGALERSAACCAAPPSRRCPRSR